MCKSAAGPRLTNGYIMMDSIMDARYKHGNKIGGNKFHYKYHFISNVSIVHCSDLVPKEDGKMRRAGNHEMRRRMSFLVCSGAASLKQNATGRQPPKEETLERLWLWL